MTDCQESARKSVRRDSEEYDTEWSSQEIVVSLPRRWCPRTHRYFDPGLRATIVVFLLVNNHDSQCVVAQPRPGFS